MIVWLIGMMGSGKTVTGAAAARLVDAPFVDTDGLVEEAQGTTIAEIWETEGEEAFRSLERQALRRVAAAHHGFAAAGGGAVLDPANVAAMKGSGTVVWLRADPTELGTRLADQGDERPLLGPVDRRQRLGSLLVARRTAYEAAADVEIDTAGRAIDAIAREVAELWSG